MTLEHGPNRTVLTGDVRDQAQLYGLLGRLQEFGIELLAVESADGHEGGREPGAGPETSGLGNISVPTVGTRSSLTRHLARSLFVRSYPWSAHADQNPPVSHGLCSTMTGVVKVVTRDRRDPHGNQHHGGVFHDHEELIPEV